MPFFFQTCLLATGDTFTIRFEMKVLKGSSSPKPTDKDGVFLRIAKARVTRKAWGSTKHAAVSGKREIAWTDTIGFTTHCVRKSDRTWGHKDAFFTLCEVRLSCLYICTGLVVFFICLCVLLTYLFYFLSFVVCEILLQN